MPLRETSVSKIIKLLYNPGHRVRLKDKRALGRHFLVALGHSYKTKILQPTQMHSKQRTQRFVMTLQKLQIIQFKFFSFFFFFFCFHPLNKINFRIKILAAFLQPFQMKLLNRIKTKRGPLLKLIALRLEAAKLYWTPATYLRKFTLNWRREVWPKRDFTE